MATQIRRSLFIGLGGTGMSSILHTKKIFADTYGEKNLPPMVGFLGIDTDGSAYQKTLKLNNGNDISLTNNEMMPISVPNARPIYTGNPEEFSWVPRECVFALGALMNGAGQVRTNGRFALTINYQQIFNKIDQMLLNITNAQIINNNDYVALGNQVEIHLVFSLSGGTGSGTFVNIASHIRNTYPTCKFRGYAVLPGIFDAMLQSPAAKANIFPNAYGAIKELDYSFHMDFNSTPIRLNYYNNTVECINAPLFNSVVFINNKNTNNAAYTHIDEVTEMIGLSLLTSTGALSNAAASVGDNLENVYASGTMNIRNKKAWIGGLGICEIQYKGADLAKIYQIKAAKNIIDRLGNTCEDIDTIVNTWIDSPNVNIRENDGQDNVINYLLKPEPSHELFINDKDNPKSEVDVFISQCCNVDGTISEKVETLTDNIRTELTNLIVKHINEECGLSTVKNIILGITAQVDLFLGEMQQEIDEKRKTIPGLDAAKDAAISELMAYQKRMAIVRSQSGTQDRCDNLISAVMCIVRNNLEIKRRQGAVKAFNATKQMLLDEQQRINQIEIVFNNVSAQLRTELAKLTNNTGREIKTFQIDLAENAAKNIKINTNTIQINGFAKSVGGDAIYTFNGLNADQIKEKLMEYTATLPDSKQLTQTTIDDVINAMSDEELNKIIEKAIQKSAPLLAYSYGQHIPNIECQDFYYIGVPDHTTNRLFKNNVVQNLTQGVASVDYSSTGVNDKIIIYRQLGVIPAYALDNLDKYRYEYEHSQLSHHIDAHFASRMNREGFDITPSRPNTSEDLLDLWVKGFIFGLIKNEDGEYKMKSDELGDPLDDNWVSLGKYRDDANEQFKVYRAIVTKEFKNFIDTYANSKGEEAITALVQDVKMNYLKNYSQINMTTEEIKAKGYERIRTLITQEIDYVKKSL